MTSRDHQSVSSDDLERLVGQFISRTLPKAGWTHEAHLRVGLWHVLNHGADDALRLLRDRIRGYNESVGTANTDTSGYHETITKFYVLVTERFLSESDRLMPIEDLAVALVAHYGDRGLPLNYYSRECLFSVTARKSWVEPDLQTIR